MGQNAKHWIQGEQMFALRYIQESRENLNQNNPDSLQYVPIVLSDVLLVPRPPFRREGFPPAEYCTGTQYQSAKMVKRIQRTNSGNWWFINNDISSVGIRGVNIHDGIYMIPWSFFLVGSYGKIQRGK